MEGANSLNKNQNKFNRYLNWYRWISNENRSGKEEKLK